MRLSQQLGLGQDHGSRQHGMTMIELLIAMAVLAIGMGGMLTVFTMAISHNGQAKSDTAGTMVAQTVLERIAAQSATSAANITMYDCSPAQQTIAVIPGGANLDPTGSLIDWTQAYAGINGNYKMQFVACGNNGRQVTYDVRWHITAISGNARMIIVSARPLVANATGTSAANNFAIPVTLRTIGGV